MNESGSQPKRKLCQSPFFRFGGSAVILTLLLTYLPFRQVLATIKRIPPAVGLELLAFYLGLHLLGVVKWRLLINLAGANLKFSDAVRCYYWGLFGNIFLPSLVGGDLVRAGMAFTVSRSKAAIVLGSLMDRAQDVAGLLTVTGVGMLLLPASLDYRTHKMFWTVAAILFLAGVCGAGLLFLVPVRKLPYKVRRILAKLRHGIRSMYRRPGRMFLCFSLGVVLQVSQVATNYALGEISGLHIAFGIWLFAWPLAKLSALVPVTQGGIGVREAALVGLLTPFGAPPVLAAAVGLTFQAIVITGGLIGGMISLLLGRLRRSDQAPATPAFATDPKPGAERIPSL